MSHPDNQPDEDDDEGTPVSPKPNLGERLLSLLWKTCFGLLLVDSLFLLKHFDKHAHFPWEEWVGFYGVFGFVSCLVLAFGAKRVLRPIVQRDEDYYD